MGTLCFTVDFDRDSNAPVAGEMPARSMSGGRIVSPRFSASAEGAAVLVEMLDGLGIPGTFFSEAETLAESRADLSGHEVALHGLAHEDLAGSYGGRPLSEAEIEGIVGKACGIVADVVGTRPLGFRAPYMRPPGCLPGVLSRLGFEYDSSNYSESGRVAAIAGGVLGLPVLRVPDGKGGKITSYLWPMHEGNREPSDFLALHDAAGDGVLVLATHTWHMSSTADGRAMGKAEREGNLRRTIEVVEAALDAGFGAKTCIAAVRSRGSRRRGP
ncbi:MAG: polysaccharide deacetylase family protein [Thermoplasmatales archaeon]|nr:polysaccharide deacetylase family protein [Thermoplasmatales archaeon]